MALYKETVTAEMWELLQKLMTDENLKGFDLVGGTALSLQIGHRLSIDLDLFTTNPYDEKKMLQYMESRYPVQVRHMFGGTILMDIAKIKVDMISHQYPLLEPITYEEGIRLFSLKDIGAMKLHAIFQSGTRIKDFVDMYFLLEHHPLKVYLDGYANKYNGNSMLAMHSLTYFRNIKNDLAVSMVKGKESKWAAMAGRLKKAISNPEIKFESGLKISNPPKKRGFKR